MLAMQLGYMRNLIESRLAASEDSERGATMVEYVLLLGLIAVVAIVVITSIGTETKAKFQTACTALKDGTACAE